MSYSDSPDWQEVVNVLAGPDMSDAPDWQSVVGGPGGVPIGGPPWMAHTLYGPSIPFNVEIVNGDTPLAIAPDEVTISFKVPASGNIYIVALFWGYMNPRAMVPYSIFIQFTDHNTGAPVSPLQQVISFGPTSSGEENFAGRLQYASSVLGLTPGDSPQWDLAGCAEGSDLVATFGADDGITGSNYFGYAEIFVYAG